MLENKTLYNRDTIHEAMKPLNRPMMIYAYIVTAILILLGAYQLIIIRTNNAILFGVALVLIAFINYRSIMKRLKGREQSYLTSVREKKGTEEYTNHLVIDETMIRNALDPNGVEMHHEDIRSTSETQNLFMIRYKTGKLVIIDKNGFSRGSVQELKEILRKYIKVK